MFIFKRNIFNFSDGADYVYLKLDFRVLWNEDILR